MANRPGASTRTTETSGAVATGSDLICVLMPVARHADAKPRQFGSAAAVFDFHGYADGVEYVALHAQQTRKPFLVCGLPIAVPGVVGRHNVAGNTGTATTTVTAGSDGVLGEHDGVLSVIAGGVVGTDQIKLGLSLDGGRTTKTIRFGTGTSYAEPYFNITIALGAGSLVVGDIVHTWHGTAPRADAAGIAAARAALAAQMKLFRTMLLIGDLQNHTDAADFSAQLKAYKTANQRSVIGRAGILDCLPYVVASKPQSRMTGSPLVTFVEVGSSGDTISRSAGSFAADDIASGDIITVAGSGSNNVTGLAATVTASTITMGSTDLVDEGPVGNVTITATPGLTFAAHTIARSRGSWFDDGFVSGQTLTVTGTASNNVSLPITGLTASTITTSATLTSEVIGLAAVTISAGQTKAEWMADCDAEFATIDGIEERRINLGAGRGRIRSAFTAWLMRRNASWFASLREYQHDVHIASWRKADGPVGADLNDVEGNLVEWDDRVDGGAGSAARFTTLTTWANGPAGAFITLDLTRAGDNSILSLHHNANVVNVAETVCQVATEDVVGRGLVLKDDGTATSDQLGQIQGEVNARLELALLKAGAEGQRASKAVWTPSSDDVLNVPEAHLTGVLELNLNVTVHSGETTVRVMSGGQS